MTLQQDISKVSLYNVVELFHSGSNIVIFNIVYLSKHKLWPYNQMRVILIAIGMHTKPCIASLAFKACSWELL